MTVTEHFADGTVRVTQSGDTVTLKLPTELSAKIARIVAEIEGRQA